MSRIHEQERSHPGLCLNYSWTKLGILKKGSSEQLVGRWWKFTKRSSRNEPLGNRNNKAYR